MDNFAPQEGIWSLFWKLFETSIGTTVIMSVYFVYYVAIFVSNCVATKTFIVDNNFIMSLVTLAVLVGSIVTAIKKSIEQKKLENKE